MGWPFWSPSTLLTREALRYRRTRIDNQVGNNCSLHLEIRARFVLEWNRRQARNKEKEKREMKKKKEEEKKQRTKKGEEEKERRLKSPTSKVTIKAELTAQYRVPFLHMP